MRQDSTQRRGLRATPKHEKRNKKQRLAQRIKMKTKVIHTISDQEYTRWNEYTHMEMQMEITQEEKKVLFLYNKLSS